MLLEMPLRFLRPDADENRDRLCLGEAGCRKGAIEVGAVSGETGTLVTESRDAFQRAVIDCSMAGGPGGRKT